MGDRVVIGIDLGTTNSEVAAFAGDRVRVLGPAPGSILPSCVGLSPEGELLVGLAARNQQLLYPDRTISSVKRRMGTADVLELGDRSLSPADVSSLILRELVSWATDDLGGAPDAAVITVPAYFSEAQRQATREAGELAGLEVLRILNEPTAASLAFAHKGQERTVLVYDLGGGTFDVSVVRIEGGVTEVLASHGDNQLGGDDLTELLAERLAEGFREQHGPQSLDGAAARSRLWWAAEQAKQALSEGPYAKVREEALSVIDGKPAHLDVEISREELDGLVRPLVEATMDSVTQAMEDAGVATRALDEILLVGGSTRMPLIRDLLQERSGLEPRADVHPDLCVALGAGVMGAKLAGRPGSPVLVDVTPHSFGISYLGERGGMPYVHCYRPIIRRNTSLPVTRTQRYFTASPYQTRVEINVFQGDDEDALRNVPVGDFSVEDLTEQEQEVEVLCRMTLDLDGLLRVSAIEKDTGKACHVTIERATAIRTAEEIAEARQRMERLWAERGESHAFEVAPEGDGAASLAGHDDAVGAGAESDPASDDRAGDDRAGDEGWAAAAIGADALLERARGALEGMHPDDREEAIEMNGRVRAALGDRDVGALRTSMEELSELLYFVTGAGD